MHPNYIHGDSFIGRNEMQRSLQTSSVVPFKRVPESIGVRTPVPVTSQDQADHPPATKPLPSSSSTDISIAPNIEGQEETAEIPLLPKSSPGSNRSFIKNLIGCCLPSTSESPVLHSNYGAATRTVRHAAGTDNAELRVERSPDSAETSSRAGNPFQNRLEEILDGEKENIRKRSLRPPGSVGDAIIRKDLDSLTKVRSLVGGLIEKIDENSSTMDIFKKISGIIRSDKSLKYNVSKPRSVYDLAYFGDGDCKAFSNLYKFLANEVLGRSDTEYKGLEGKFAIPVSHSKQIPGVQEGDSFQFSRHTILSVKNDIGRERFFDPTFGVEVDPTHYGKIIERYLLKNT
jgi:hypothetical protein